jgi:hypothetical protein
MTTVFKLIIAFFLTAFLGCNSSTGNQKTCNPYFQFDKIEHYYLEIEENQIWDIEKKKIKTNKEKRQLELLIEYTPDKLSDSLVLKDIGKLDFVTKEIPTNKFGQINEIFCQRNHGETIAMACIAIYRDILVFKKNNKIVGIAKICFECDQHVISGTIVNTDEFGQSGDYGKLYKLLH